jgi:hypothetical protein
MSKTFKALCDYADWSGTSPIKEVKPKTVETKPDPNKDEKDPPIDKDEKHKRIKTTELPYNIQIHLPESRDPSVYDAIFTSLKEHFN